MNKKELIDEPNSVPALSDAATVQLIIRSSVHLTKCALGAGVFLACFVLVTVTLRPESAQLAAVIMTAAAGLVGIPGIAQAALLALLARTRTEPQAPTGTPTDPVSVTPTEATPELSDDKGEDK